ncbi:hypothetical protein E4U13_000254 [Claviceps humidiphila]|uniref:Uncharacterized protein n=1 Tax=Claviceps humidiphila TaxID=1294629 RepID=A0A9P7TR54_9HYPO|nr:hypothetical protein E4U13_000254 [Claviceps humidiphila]
MVAALQPVDEKKLQEAKGRVTTSFGKLEGQSIAEAASIVIQQEVLEFVCGRLETFRSASVKDQLAQRLESDNARWYGNRFREAEWAGVLDIVRWYMGPEFRPEWARPEESRPGDVSHLVDVAIQNGKDTLAGDETRCRDRIDVTLTTPTELRGYLCRTIANAKDPAAIEMVTTVLQEALATISKPLSSQGASEDAKSDPATHSTGTCLEVDPESLSTINTLLRIDEKLPVTRQGSTDLSDSAARCKMITSTPREHSGTGADETGMYLDDCIDFGESLSISPARIGSKRGVDMPPAGTKVTTTRSTPKSLPQMQSTIPHDSATRGQPKITRIIKTKTHLVGSKGAASDQRTHSSPPPSKQMKERWEMQAMSKMPSAGTKVTTRSTPKSLPQIQSTISYDSATRSQSKITPRRPHILKTKTHLEDSNKKTLTLPSKQTKERWETQAMSKNR